MGGGFSVGELHIGPGSPPVVVAEMSGNHNGDLNRALDIVDEVANSGAQVLKLQTYTADTLTLNVNRPPFRVGADHALWGGRNLYELYEQAHTPWEWHAPIFERCRQRGLVPFSSAFDTTAVELLESLDCAMYKVASAELVDLPLIARMASTGRPLVISTGMATLSEIDLAVTSARDAGCRDLVLLTCTASYPADASDAHLLSIPVLRDAFDVPVGLSDHTPGIGVAVAAVALGACVIEKHVTLARDDGGVDSSFSLQPGELSALTSECLAAFEAVRPARFGPRDSERDVLMLRRSLYVVCDVRAGEEVTRDNVRSIRPSGGLAPDELDSVLGRRFVHDVSRGTPLTLSLV
jgi:pseudaminic acid synthase